jgi:hypothetical protein
MYLLLGLWLAMIGNSKVPEELVKAGGRVESRLLFCLELTTIDAVTVALAAKESV